MTPGRLADLIVVEGDPTKNISDVRRVVTVVKDGHVVSARALYQAAGLTY